MDKSKMPVLLPIRCLMFLMIFVVGAAVVGKNVNDISNWWTIVATAVNLVTIIILALTAKKNKQTYAEMILYEKGKTNIGSVVDITVLTLVMGCLGMYISGFIFYGVILYSPPEMIEPIPKVLAIVNMVLLPLMVPFAEDGLYLGYGVNRIKNKYAAILVPAFFYALQHCFIPTSFEWRYILYRFFSFLPLTIFFCWYYRKKSDPVPIMVGHAVIDVMTVSLVFITSMFPGVYEKWLS
jgi:membrane protease YdiL (CAAX protease family)